MGIYQGHRGIVIASQMPQKNKIVLLDQEQGKMVCVPDRHTVTHGMLLQYFVRTDKNTQFLYASELLATMDPVAAQDLLFFQHVMELCYYFLPLSCPAQQTFELLCFLYGKTPLSSLEKKLFLCKFFVLLGLYPEEHSHDAVRICHLILSPIDMTLSHCVDLGFKEAELDTWLLNCVLTHPASASFKTVHFLTADRSV